MTSLGVRTGPSASAPAGNRGSISRLLIGCAAAMAFGAYLPTSPWDAFGWLAIIPLVLFVPVASVGVCLAVTVLVPWDLQSEFKVVGGPDQPGLLFIDALMLLALVRLGWLLLRRRVDFDTPLVVGVVVAGLCTGALLWGIANGASVSEAGHEWRRVILGVGTFLLSWPLMSTESARRRLLYSLMLIGLLLGVWGIAQWAFDVGYTTSGDVGVRGGLDSGQLQGSLYDYPVAVVMAWAALVSGQVRRPSTSWLLSTVLCLNVICVLLTFERTLMVASVASCAFVVVLYGRAVGTRAMKMAGVGLALLAVAAVIASTEARTVTGRLALLGDVDSDHSYTHRLVETEVVTGEIVKSPVIGSGFGATVTWGVPNMYPVSTTPFADMGYHWLAWKIGLPASLLVLFLLLRAVLRRQPDLDNPQWRAVRTGARGALAALLVISVLFGVFNSLNITAVIGVLVAICYSRALPQTSAPQGRATTPPSSERP